MKIPTNEKLIEQFKQQQEEKYEKLVEERFPYLEIRKERPKSR